MSLTACRAVLHRFVSLAGADLWRARIAEIKAGCVPGHAGRALAQHHALELMIERLRFCPNGPRVAAEREVVTLAADALALHGRLSPAGQSRMVALLEVALRETGTPVFLFQMLRAARLQRGRGFAVRFAGLEDGASFDLTLSREGAEAEMACELVSAEEGRGVHRGAWHHLVDRVDPDLQAWLATHPGRYLLKMTLPQGLKAEPGSNAALAELHGRITRMLGEARRADHCSAAVLRLDPLVLAGAQAGENGLMRDLRAEFGPEAHLAVTQSGGGMLVLAARAGSEDEVAEAVQRRAAAIAPERLSGTRPGILAMFVEDTDRLEWRRLRDQLQLEGAVRQFMTSAEARHVVAVTCASRQELLGGVPPDAAEDGELRYRNPSHPAAKVLALAPAVVSST